MGKLALEMCFFAVKLGGLWALTHLWSQAQVATQGPAVFGTSATEVAA